MKPLKLLLFILVASTTVLRAQQPNQNNQQMQNNPQMQAMTSYMTPGDAQMMLAKSAGDWKADVTFIMDPSQPPMKSAATVHNEMILGGRYLSQHYTGNMMGQPFEGMGTIAYDNGKKVYLSTWIDNMGTGITYLEGKPSADNKSVEFKGTAYLPGLGDVPMRQVVTFIDDNHQTFQEFITMGGKEVNSLSINLSR
jgi:hypothetical protein